MTNKATPSTIALPPDASVISYTIPSLPNPTQPHTTPIAHFASSPNTHPTGSLIAISNSYIVYVVKNGLVRVIDRQKALRTLLRGHTKRVTDLAFFSNVSDTSSKSDVLGTVGGEGDAACVFIWRIFEDTTQQEEIGSEKLLEVRYKPAVRLIWHPLNPNQFFLLDRPNTNQGTGQRGGGGVIVETTKLDTINHPMEGHAVCDCGTNGSDLGQAGVFLWSEKFRDVGCVDFSWSEWNTDYTAICGGGGNVILWDWKSSGKIVSVLSVGETGTEVVDSIMFVYRIEGVAKNFDQNDMKKYLTEPFVTGIKGNSQIDLWSNFQTMSDGVTISATKMRTFKMTNFPVSLHMSMCSGAQSFYDNVKAYIVLSDRNSLNLYAIHVGTEQRAPYKIATGFDSITQFQVMHPILSWSVMGEMVVDDQEAEEEDDEEGGENFEISLFCVQSTAVQMLKLKPKMLRRPKIDYPELNLPSNVKAEFDKTLEKQDGFEENGAEELDADQYEYEDYDESALDLKYETNESDDEVNVSPPLAASLPPPGLTNNFKSDDSNSFSNWLGAIASGTTPSMAPVLSKTPAQAEPTESLEDQSSSRDKTPTALKSDSDEKHIQSQPKMFLSPVELISSSGGEQNKPVPVTSYQNNAPSNPKTQSRGPVSKSSSSRKKSPKRSSNNESRSKKSSSPTPPKFHILKREPTTATDIFPSANSTKSSSSADINIEEILKRNLQSQLKMHEGFVITEVQRTLKSEMKGVLLPGLTKNLLQGMEQNVVRPIQTNLNKGMKDREKKLVKDVLDSVRSEVKETTTRAFQQSMREVLVPAFEAATQQMFAQVSETLSKTQLDYENDNRKLVESLSSQISSLSEQVSFLSTELTTMKNNIQNQRLIGANQATEDSRDPNVVLQEQIQALISETNYSAAFTKALSASSAEIAVFCCKQADISFLLNNDNSILSQPILLCLMQQLGSVLANTSVEADLYMVSDWLQDIAVSINPNDLSIKKHVAEIVKSVTENILGKLNNVGTDSKMRRKLQMLTQVIRGVGY